ncbi:hypothetical protein BDV95DRAFT_68086 [Massariosphaeria phaeospora]|uniref:Uncharacterized protein n=1 Tax=Massariosphaeria phaeospora TaxID=100035 RepID=A0A7C8I4P5_9PLEO|nr:hypothetical protein BDV95DRAFT_68086 [Massariosphaeria phaeospora]
MQTHSAVAIRLATSEYLHSDVRLTQARHLGRPRSHWVGFSVSAVVPALRALPDVCRAVACGVVQCPSQQRGLTHLGLALDAVLAAQRWLVALLLLPGRRAACERRRRQRQIQRDGGVGRRGGGCRGGGGRDRGRRRGRGIRVHGSRCMPCPAGCARQQGSTIGLARLTRLVRSWTWTWAWVWDRRGRCTMGGNKRLKAS